MPNALRVNLIKRPDLNARVILESASIAIGKQNLVVERQELPLGRQLVQESRLAWRNETEAQLANGAKTYPIL